MQAGQPRWRRRKEARPGEILEAAFAVFAEKGFAAARLDEIAARAGVSKGALYLYFETKEALFQAMVRDRVTPNVRAVVDFAQGFEGSFAELVRIVLPRAAAVLAASGAGKVVKIVIGESRNFPELARFWHDEVIAVAMGALSGLISRAQARGEVGPGDPRFQAVSLMAPLLMGVIWGEVLEPVGADPLPLDALAQAHAETALAGLLAEPAHA